MVFTLNDSLIIDGTGNVGIGTMPKSSFDISSTNSALTIPGGTTLQRVNNEGMFRFNTETELYELYRLGSWSSFAMVPTIASVDTQVLKNIDSSVTVTGSSFHSSAQWRFVGNSKKHYIPKSVTQVSDSSVSLVRPDVLPPSDAPYQIQCRQMGKVVYFSPITTGNMPVFVSSAGLTVTGGTAITPFEIVVNDEVSGGIASVSITSGSLPTGLVGEFTAVGVNGKYTISGTPAAVTLTTTYPITLTATDLGDNVVSQDYNIVVDSSTLYTVLTTNAKNSVMVAFSLRKVNSTYVGAVVKVRRSSDNLENDFYGSSTGALTNATGTSISTWLGAATGYVSVWYDQSGVGRNATQATASYQPILNLTQFTFPTIHFNSSSETDQKYLLIGNLTLTAPFTFIFTSRKTRSGRWISHNTNNPNTLIGYHGSSEASFYMDNNPGSPYNRYPVVYNQDFIHMAGKSSTSLDYYFVNGNLRHDTVAGTATNFGNSIMLGGGAGTTEFGAGYFMEMTIHNIVIPRTELNVVQNNIQKYYNIATVPIDLPYLISGLQLYLDASTHTVGSAVWSDKSANKYDFSIASGMYSTSGGVPHMNIEGAYGAPKRIVSSALSNVPSFANATIVIFSTILNSTATWRTLIRGATGDHQVLIESGLNNMGMYDQPTGYYASGFNVTNIPNYTTKFNMLVWKLSTASPYYQFKFNETTTWYSITNANATFNNGFAVIGAAVDGSTSTGLTTSGSSQYWGKVGMFLYFNKHLSDAEISSIYNTYKYKFGLDGPLITSSQPANITQSTLSTLYTTSYTFTGTASVGSIAWSITPTTYGNIDASTGALTLTFPQGTTASGTFVVTATDTNASVSQSWTYTMTSMLPNPIVKLSQAPSSGATWIDASGNGNNGTIGGTYSFTNEFGGGIVSTSGYISVPYNISGTVTISIVAKLTPSAYWATLWANESYTATKGYFSFFESAGNLWTGAPWTGSVPGTNSYAITGQSSINAWDFVISGTTYTLYKNGVEVDTGSFAAPSGGLATTNLYFGARHGNAGTGYTDVCPGTYYQMMVYNNALTSTEITQQFNSMQSRFFNVSGAFDGTLASQMPVAAYSLRRLFTTYQGPQVRVRRSGDNFEADVYFDSSRIVYRIVSTAGGDDWATWISGKTLYVTTWYDQSGVGNHVTQTSTSKQPTLNTSKNAVEFDSTLSQCLQRLPGILAAGDDTYTFAGAFEPRNTNLSVLFEQHISNGSASTFSSTRACAILINGNIGHNGQDNDAHNIVAYALNQKNKFVMRINNSNSPNVLLNYNGSSYTATSGTRANLAVSGEAFGMGFKVSANAEYFNGFMYESFVYNVDVPDDFVSSLNTAM